MMIFTNLHEYFSVMIGVEERDIGLLIFRGIPINFRVLRVKTNADLKVVCMILLLL